MARRLTREKFIERARAKHGDKYDYSKVDYRNLYHKVEIVCPDHGPFFQRPQAHVYQGHGCAVCAGVKRKTLSDYQKLGKRIGASLVGELPNSTSIDAEWACSKSGGIFFASYQRVKQYGRCIICHPAIDTTKPRKPESDYHDLASLFGGEWIGNSLPSYLEPTKWMCSDGHIWESSFATVSNTPGCPVCAGSSGEQAVASTLSSLGFEYAPQVSFDTCVNPKTGYKLRFDFLVKTNGQNVLVEYDGEQHFRPVEPWGGEEALREVVYRDLVKSEWAKENGYRLIRIKYDTSDIGECLAKMLT